MTIIRVQGGHVTHEQDLYLSHMRGFRDGAAMRAMSVKFTQHSNPGIRNAYNAGFTNGYKARGLEGKKAAELYGYKPSILRVQAEDDGQPKID